MTENPESEVLDPEGAAALLGLCIETVRELSRQGELPCRKAGHLWRYRRSALLKWLEGDHSPDPKEQSNSL